MAIGAQTRRHQVRVGQRETGGRVIELAIGPDHGVVAGVALGAVTAAVDVLNAMAIDARDADVEVSLCLNSPRRSECSGS